MNYSNQQSLDLKTSLLNFRTCIEQCLELISKFNDGTSWFIKVFNNQTFKHEFEELNVQLSQSATDLNLSINLKQIFDSESG